MSHEAKRDAQVAVKNSRRERERERERGRERERERKYQTWGSNLFVSAVPISLALVGGMVGETNADQKRK